MQHTVYFGQKPLYLTTAAPVEPGAQVAVGSEIDGDGIVRIIKRLSETQVKAAYLVFPHMDRLLDAFKSHFTFIQAAGGLVQSDKGKVLLIFRKGKWDLPKGKLDPGEDLSRCAVREVEEETGLGQIRLVQPLHVSYHTYYQDGAQCLKESHWYLMRAPEQANLKPQLEEGIEQCIWVTTDALPQYRVNIHGSIADVLDAGMPFLDK